MALYRTSTTHLEVDQQGIGSRMLTLTIKLNESDEHWLSAAAGTHQVDQLETWALAALRLALRGGHVPMSSLPIHAVVRNVQQADAVDPSARLPALEFADSSPISDLYWSKADFDRLLLRVAVAFQQAIERGSVSEDDSLSRLIATLKREVRRFNRSINQLEQRAAGT